jgi:TM2 domain-containing membrane protein YozV
MSGATFGRKQTVDGAAMAERRAAFLAEERARADRLALGVGVESPRLATASEPVYVREKGLGTAYLLWFFLGGLSGHRFYLGYSTSGIVQAVLTPIGYAMAISGTMAGLAISACGGLWILADAFLMPGMQRQCNARLRRLAVGAVFA